jgi:hypothetical protein
MRRFNYDDDSQEDANNYFDGDFDEMGISPEEYKGLMEEQGRQIEMQAAMVHRELNQRILFKVIKTLEKSWLWRFYSLDTRLKMITKTYQVFVEQLDHELA